MGKTERRFEARRVRMLVTAEFAPGGMEFARHAEIVHAKRLRIACGQRKVVVTPASGRRRFQFQMTVDMGKVAAAATLMAAVMENRKTGLDLVHRFPNAAGIVQVSRLAQGGNGRFIARVLTG